MDTETVSPNFDDIRPLNNSEVKDAIEKLVANEDFERALRYIKPNLNWEEFSVAISIHFVFLFLSSSSIMSVMTSFISNPAARTCCGIKLVAVIPGVVFISSKTGSPSAGII